MLGGVLYDSRFSHQSQCVDLKTRNRRTEVCASSLIGVDMKVGDLVRMTQYHYWGLGIVVDFDETGTHKAAFVRWADGRGGWRYIEDLEVL